jgi:hypothetical protein
MYSALAQTARVPSDRPDDPPPDTIITKAIETVDNDRAYALMAPIGFS